MMETWHHTYHGHPHEGLIVALNQIAYSVLFSKGPLQDHMFDYSEIRELSVGADNIRPKKVTPSFRRVGVYEDVEGMKVQDHRPFAPCDKEF